MTEKGSVGTGGEAWMRPVQEEDVQFEDGFWSAVKELRADTNEEIPASISVVENIHYFTKGGGTPESVEDNYELEVRTDEQAYKRITSVGFEWQDVDLGWLKGQPLSIFYIKNKSKEDGPGLLVRQGEGAAWFIEPGCSFRGQPTNPDSLQVKSAAADEPCPFFMLVCPR